MTTLFLFQEASNLSAPASGLYETLTNGIVLATIIDILIKIGGAILALLLGRWLIGYAVRAVDNTLRTQKVDRR